VRTNPFALSPLPDSFARYDHQTVPYNAQFSAGASGVDHVTVAPYFSPDHSADSTVKYIDSAVSTIEIATPGFESWSKCDQSPFCSPSEMRAEAFPVFGALLNALHRGVAVRIVTNNYNSPAQPSGTVSLLDFLALNGAKISFYTSTTFMHAKYMAIDGKVVSISSVNYSQTSYMENREAGLYITGTDIVKFCATVFDYDFSAATPLVPGSYTQSELKIITDTTQIKVHPTFFIAAFCSQKTHFTQPRGLKRLFHSLRLSCLQAQ
jgi:phosphatidylserine/phosphatidylglycerophosphate/cardiolipin synthase-like enzyme